MIRTKRRLTLNAETIRVLSSVDGVAGGLPVTSATDEIQQSCCAGCTSGQCSGPITCTVETEPRCLPPF